MSIHPLYNEYFPSEGPPPADWNRFRVYNKSEQPDLSIETPTTWHDTLLKVMKVFILPFLVHLCISYLIGRIAMAFICPAQYIPKPTFAHSRYFVEHTLFPANPDHIYREVTLQKDGIGYNGILLGHKNNISNGKWALFAPGNNITIEQVLMTDNHLSFLKADYNLLMINSPNVGRSKGTPAPKTLGEAQQLGITFLETALKAQRIVLSGHSLGAAAVGEAIKTHDFKPHIDYLVIRLMTFSKLSHIVNKVAGKFPELVLHFINYDMDQVAASKLLQEKNIHEVIFEAGREEITVGATLTEALPNHHNKTLRTLPDYTHNQFPHAELTQEIQRWDRAHAPPAAV